MNKHVVVVLGVGLAVGCTPKDPPISNPPPPENPAPPTANPPPPLPTWDEVASGHPEGATNPPYPVLIVTPDGQHCYKQWFGGMVRGPEDHVQACGPDECGTEIQCPEPRAQELLAASKAGQPAPSDGPK